MRCFVQLVNPFFSAVFVNYLISLTFCKGPLRSRSQRGTNYSKGTRAAQVPLRESCPAVIPVQVVALALRRGGTFSMSAVAPASPSCSHWSR